MYHMSRPLPSPVTLAGWLAYQAHSPLRAGLEDAAADGVVQRGLVAQLLCAWVRERGRREVRNGLLEYRTGKSSEHVGFHSCACGTCIKAKHRCRPCAAPALALYPLTCTTMTMNWLVVALNSYSSECSTVYGLCTLTMPQPGSPKPSMDMSGLGCSRRGLVGSRGGGEGLCMCVTMRISVCYHVRGMECHETLQQQAGVMYGYAQSHTLCTVRPNELVTK